MAKIGRGDLKTDLPIYSPHEEGHLCLTSTPWRGSCFFFSPPAHLTDNCQVVNGDPDNELRKPGFGWKTERREAKGISSQSLDDSLLGKNQLKIANVLGPQLRN